MKVLLSSVPFEPMVGGIETVSGILACELSSLGCEVIVVTQTPSERSLRKRYEVLRRPDFRKLHEVVRWSDVVFHNNISLRGALPIALLSKPWMIAHHTWLPRSGTGALAGNLKRLAARRAYNVAISSAVAQDVGTMCTIIPNPYDDDRFRLDRSVARDRDIVFVGRLVSDKGVTILIDALAALALREVRPSVTIIGTGDQERGLRDRVAASEFRSQVEFAGQLVGDVLVQQLNRHHLMVIPSVWREPFGIVALEGIACGCIPVAARSGGLVDAVGQCGVLFERGDAADLAVKLEALLSAPAALERYRGAAASHLARHTKRAVAHAYLGALEQTRARQPSGGSAN